MANGTPNSREIQAAFAEYDRQETISNFKVACIIGMILMPAGVILDYAVYPGLAPQFLKLRFLSSVLIGAFLSVLLTPLGRRNYRLLGITLFMLPASFIAWMIYASPEGAASPYYAGLNLVLLVLAFVLHWTFRESLSAAVLVLGLYLAAALFHPGRVPPADRGVFVNNIYFLVLTGIIVATGSYFHSKSRFNEFAFRHELDKQNKVLESTIQQLKETKTQLVQSEKLASLGPDERRHHSRDQQPAELRHHRPVHPAEQGQTPRAGTAGGISGHPEGRGGGDQAGEDHRFRPEDVYAS